MMPTCQLRQIKIEWVIEYMRHILTHARCVCVCVGGGGGGGGYVPSYCVFVKEIKLYFISLDFYLTS